MSKSLVVVESPAKAKTISRYLGKNYVVKASVGHIKDLPKSKLGVDVDKDFAPDYSIIPGKAKVVKELRSAAKGINDIYLAADPDREGEAICQHLAEELKGKSRNIYRISKHYFKSISGIRIVYNGINIRITKRRNFKLFFWISFMGAHIFSSFFYYIVIYEKIHKARF